MSLPDISWVIEGKRLRLGDREYVLAEDYDRLVDSIADLTQRHNNLQVNILKQNLKKGRRLGYKEKKRVVKAALQDQAKAILATRFAKE